MTDQPRVTLNNGVRMPQLGFGVWQVRPGETQAAVEAALEVGYRSIDTAAMYGNEAEVGKAIAASGLDRDDVFVTTKLNNDGHGTGAARDAFERSREALGLERVDLYLIHWPLPKRDRYVETWQTLEGLLADKSVRAIGVSNFHTAYLDRLAAETGTVPAVNQVELHPYLTQRAVRDYDAEHGIATEAWSPLASGGLLKDPELTAIGEKYGKSVAQIVIRWHLEIGNVVIPKSVTPSRIQENFEVFDFELDTDDVAAISSLNRDERTGPDPADFDWVPN